MPASDTSSSSVSVAAGHLRSFGSGKALTIALIDSRSLTREGLVRLLDGTERLNLISLSRCSDLLAKPADVLSEVEIVLLNLGSAVIRDPEIVKDIALLH